MKRSTGTIKWLLRRQALSQTSASSVANVTTTSQAAQKFDKKRQDFAHPKGLRYSVPAQQPSLEQEIGAASSKQIELPVYPFTQEDELDINPKFKGLETDLPCLRRAQRDGPEPEYSNVVSGYKIFSYDKPFRLRYSNGVLPKLDIAYETWGELNEQRDNAILLCTGLSASSHAKSHPDNDRTGWWEKFIGPGCALDTDKYFVICQNNLGGCYGTTGPMSVNPETKEPYGTTFPIISVEDMVQAQFLLLDDLGIDKVSKQFLSKTLCYEEFCAFMPTGYVCCWANPKLYACVGSSLGGMSSLTASVLFPDRLHKAVSISACASTHPSAIVLRYLQRKAIMMDPQWHKGHYYTVQGAYPRFGMKLARELSTITYRSGPEWDMRFGRRRIDDRQEPTLCPYFDIESYLEYQGEQFCTRYDPNSIIYISKAMDLFDLSETFGTMEDALSRVTCPIMVIGVKTDLLFPVWQQRELAQQLQEAGNEAVTYYELNSIYGHDTFLLDLNGVGAGVKGFLDTHLPETGRTQKRRDRKSPK